MRNQSWGAGYLWRGLAVRWTWVPRHLRSSNDAARDGMSFILEEDAGSSREYEYASEASRSHRSPQRNM